MTSQPRPPSCTALTPRASGKHPHIVLRPRTCFLGPQPAVPLVRKRRRQLYPDQEKKPDESVRFRGRTETLTDSSTRRPGPHPGLRAAHAARALGSHPARDQQAGDSEAAALGSFVLRGLSIPPLTVSSEKSSTVLASVLSGFNTHEGPALNT